MSTARHPKGLIQAYKSQQEEYNFMIVRNPNDTHFQPSTNNQQNSLNQQYNYSFCDEEDFGMQNQNIDPNQTPNIKQKFITDNVIQNNVYIRDYQEGDRFLKCQQVEQPHKTEIQFKNNKKNHVEVQDRYSFNPLHRKIDALQKTCRKIYQTTVQQARKNQILRFTTIQLQTKINKILELFVKNQNCTKNMTINSINEQSNQLNKYIQPYEDHLKLNQIPLNIKITNPRPDVKKFCSSQQSQNLDEKSQNLMISQKNITKQNNENFNSMNLSSNLQNNKTKENSQIIPIRKMKQKKNEKNSIHKNRVKSQNDIKTNKNNSKRKMRKSSAKKNLQQTRTMHEMNIQAQNYLQNSLIFQAVQVPKQSKSKNKMFLKSLEEKRRLIDQQLSKRLADNSFLNISQNHSNFYPSHQETKRQKKQIFKQTQSNGMNLRKLQTYESQSIKQSKQHIKKQYEKSLWRQNNMSEMYTIDQSLNKIIKNKKPLQYYFTTNFTQS